MMHWAPAGHFAPTARYHHLRLKALLLAVWVVVSFGACYFARDMQAWADWPLAYWMAAQGAVLMFLSSCGLLCGHGLF
jgi:putative solute:sodium symporter small subunit